MKIELFVSHLSKLTRRQKVTMVYKMRASGSVVQFLKFIQRIFQNLCWPQASKLLVGFNYRLKGSADRPEVLVNPLSIFTPAIFREIFRRPVPNLE